MVGLVSTWGISDLTDSVSRVVFLWELFRSVLSVFTPFLVHLGRAVNHNCLSLQTLAEQHLFVTVMMYLISST